MTPESLQFQQNAGEIIRDQGDTRREAARDIMEKARTLRAEAQDNDLGFIVYLLEMVIVETGEILEADNRERPVG